MAAIKSLKSYFLRGLAVLLPAIVTIWILVWGYKFIQNSIGVHINRLLAWLTITIQGGPENVDAQMWRHFWIDGLGSLAGFIIALAIVLVVGAIVANVVGRTIGRAVERFIMNLPVLNQIYPYIKQVTDFFLVQEKKEKLFSRVVLVEFPRKGSWAVGFVTGSGARRLEDSEKKGFLTVFVSTTPSPLTGFVIMVPKDETIESDMTIEEAFRFIISGGVITPHSNINANVSDETELAGIKE
jgi:uncharacterized membrane protein